MELKNKLWEEKIFKYAIISAILWSMIHVYAFSRLMVSHDSLREFYASASIGNGYTGMTWKIALGRIVAPFYRKLLRGTVTLPWIIGLLSSLYLFLSVYVTARIFSLKRFWVIFISAGILISNPAVFLRAATFINDMDIDMLGVLFSTVAVWCWKEENWLFWGVGALCVSLSMGIYASFLSVTVVMVLFVSILALLERAEPAAVLIKGIKAIAMIVAGMLLYAAMTYVVCRITGVELAQGQYNSITNISSLAEKGNLQQITAAYRDVAHTLSYELFGHGSSRDWLSIAVLVLGAAVLIVKVIKAKLGILAGVMVFALLGLVPIAMDLSMIANHGGVHDLMKYALVLAYLLILLLAEQVLCAWGRKGKAAGALLMTCIALICWQYAIQANQIYLKKDLENRFVSSLMTRMMTQIEQRDDYIPAQTKLLFAGDMNHQIWHRRELLEYWSYTGISSNTPIQQWSLYEPYLEYMMGIPVIYCDTQERWDLVTDQRVIDMPIYPLEGSIQMIDGVLVTKVGPVP